MGRHLAVAAEQLKRWIIDPDLELPALVGYHTSSGDVHDVLQPLTRSLLLQLDALLQDVQNGPAQLPLERLLQRGY